MNTENETAIDFPGRKYFWRKVGHTELYEARIDSAEGAVRATVGTNNEDGLWYYQVQFGAGNGTKLDRPENGMKGGSASKETAGSAAEIAVQALLTAAEANAAKSRSE